MCVGGGGVYMGKTNGRMCKGNVASIVCVQRILLYCHLFYSLIGYLDCVQTLPVDSSHDVIMSHDYYNNDFILNYITKACNP